MLGGEWLAHLEQDDEADSQGLARFFVTFTFLLGLMLSLFQSFFWCVCVLFFLIEVLAAGPR